MTHKPTIKEKQRTVFERQRNLRTNPTFSELLFKQRLEELGVNFIFQKCFIAADYYCIVDFYLPKPYKIVFEIDGDYHDTMEQKIKDARKDYYLTKVRKFKVVRIKNKDVGTFNIQFLTKK